MRPEEAIGIEDAAAGVDAINAAGMLSVGIGPGLNHAGLQLHSTQELTGTPDGFLGIPGVLIRN